jgi:hypothetical protein
MEDTELYRHVLGIEEPWRVDRVQLNVKDERVDVWRFMRKDCVFLARVRDESSDL